MIDSVPRPWPIRATFTGKGLDKQTKLVQSDGRKGFNSRFRRLGPHWMERSVLSSSCLWSSFNSGVKQSEGKGGQSKRTAEK